MLELPVFQHHQRSSYRVSLMGIHSDSGLPSLVFRVVSRTMRCSKLMSSPHVHWKISVLRLVTCPQILVRVPSKYRLRIGLNREGPLQVAKRIISLTQQVVYKLGWARVLRNFDGLRGLGVTGEPCNEVQDFQCRNYRVCER
jgi:hypothetical protein